MEEVSNPSACSEISKIVNSEEYKSDQAKAYEGNKAAIRRMRVRLTAISKLCKTGRFDLSNVNVK